MASTTPQQPDSGTGQGRYSAGYGSGIQQYTNVRSATVQGSFILPHLRPGMSLLDCGCGPGTITVGLAEILDPGEVIGIDIEASQIERAQSLASEKGTSNVRFQVASMYELPFPDSSFDAIFEHAAMMYLREPLKALQEMRRVLKPGGVIGICDADFTGDVQWPSNPMIIESLAIWKKVWEHNGGTPNFGRQHRSLLREAGFIGIEASAYVDPFGTPEATQRWGDILANMTLEGPFAETAIELGLADRAKVEQMVAAFKEWGKHPDAFFTRTWCTAVAWKE